MTNEIFKAIEEITGYSKEFLIGKVSKLKEYTTRRVIIYCLRVHAKLEIDDIAVIMNRNYTNIYRALNSAIEAKKNDAEFNDLYEKVVEKISR